MFGLDWINDVVAWFAQWLPRWDVCEPTHRGVRFRGTLWGEGVETSTIEPGMFMWWPLTTRVYVIPVVRQSANLPAQSLETCDGHAMLVETVMVYKIADVEKALTENYDLDDTIMEIAHAAAVDCIVTRSRHEVRDDLATGELNKQLKEEARRLLRRYGVNVVDARFTDAAVHTCIRTAGHTAVLPIPAGGEE